MGNDTSNECVDIVPPHEKLTDVENGVKLWKSVIPIIDQKITDETTLIDVLTKLLLLQVTKVDDRHFNGLKYFFTTVASQEEKKDFFENILPSLQRIVVNSPHELPTNIPTLLSQGRVTISSKTIATLLTISFFGLWDPYYKFNMHTMFRGTPHGKWSNTQVIKFRALLNYFKSITEHVPIGYVTFIRQNFDHDYIPTENSSESTTATTTDNHRKTIQDWSSSSTKINTKLLINPNDSIGCSSSSPSSSSSASTNNITSPNNSPSTTPTTYHRVVFSSQLFAENVFDKGFSEEDLQCLMSPEMIVFRLISSNSTVSDYEYVLFQGLNVYSFIKTDEFGSLSTTTTSATSTSSPTPAPTSKKEMIRFVRNTNAHISNTVELRRKFDNFGRLNTTTSSVIAMDPSFFKSQLSSQYLSSPHSTPSSTPVKHNNNISSNESTESLDGGQSTDLTLNNNLLILRELNKAYNGFLILKKLTNQSSSSSSSSSSSAAQEVEGKRSVVQQEGVGEGEGEGDKADDAEKKEGKEGVDSVEEVVVVARTGHWGGGSRHGGDIQLKALIQLAAASEAGIVLDYHTYDSYIGYSFSNILTKFHEFLIKKDISVGELCDLILKYGNSRFLYSKIVSQLKTDHHYQHPDSDDNKNNNNNIHQQHQSNHIDPEYYSSLIEIVRHPHHKIRNVLDLVKAETETKILNKALAKSSIGIDIPRLGHKLSVHKLNYEDFEKNMKLVHRVDSSEMNSPTVNKVKRILSIFSKDILELDNSDEILRVFDDYVKEATESASKSKVKIDLNKTEFNENTDDSERNNNSTDDSERSANNNNNNAVEEEIDLSRVIQNFLEKSGLFVSKTTTTTSTTGQLADTPTKLQNSAISTTTISQQHPLITLLKATTNQGILASSWLFLKLSLLKEFSFKDGKSGWTIQVYYSDCPPREGFKESKQIVVQHKKHETSKSSPDGLSFKWIFQLKFSYDKYPVDENNNNNNTDTIDSSTVVVGGLPVLKLIDVNIIFDEITIDDSSILPESIKSYFLDCIGPWKR
eukprot:TRINITY_DN1940_c0_g1_i1.p1 TRINITY_DN1940_c0_g1~~TRINITY_DN1940_c0_g1_i1.p1  ORF type:complete len:1032 (-),score=323.52 TRINITY_DN1940_c0_g1_i1:56-3151(-)